MKNHKKSCIYLPASTFDMAWNGRTPRYAALSLRVRPVPLVASLTRAEGRPRAHRSGMGAAGIGPARPFSATRGRSIASLFRIGRHGHDVYMAIGSRPAVHGCLQWRKPHGLNREWLQYGFVSKCKSEVWEIERCVEMRVDPRAWKF